MNRRGVVKMQRKVQFLQKALGELGPVMRGSVVVIGTKNKQPYFSLNKDKKTHLIYLGKNRVERAREYSQNYKRLLAIVEEQNSSNWPRLSKVSGR